MRIEGSGVLVTGGASGLGAATASELGARGARVTILDRDGEHGAGLAREMGWAFEQVDVTDDASVARAVAATLARGRIDVLVNCAGIATSERMLGRDGVHGLDSFRRTIDVNLTGSFNMIRHVAEAMGKGLATGSEDRGVIVNTASIAAFDGQKGQVAYAASKAGVAGMTLPLARDLASRSIRVCTIAPGIFATPMLRALSPEVQAALAEDVTFPRRLGEPEEFARLVCFIIECGYLNGEVIRLDGGLRMG